jgi:hypothetical protein
MLIIHAFMNIFESKNTNYVYFFTFVYGVEFIYAIYTPLLPNDEGISSATDDNPLCSSVSSLIIPESV